MTPAETEVELERLHAAGFAWALACCGRHREEAEDVLQASYLKILDGRARFAGRSSFKTFLFAVIRRTASEERRKGALVSLLFGSGKAREETTAREAAPVERLALQAALARLPRRQRQVLELVFSAENEAALVRVAPARRVPFRPSSRNPRQLQRTRCTVVPLAPEDRIPPRPV